MVNMLVLVTLEREIGKGIISKRSGADSESLSEAESDIMGEPDSEPDPEFDSETTGELLAVKILTFIE